MNLGAIKTPRHFWMLFEHRLLRPSLWNRWSSKRLSGLSDAEFLTLCSFHGSGHEFIADFHDRARLRFFFHPRNKKDFFLNLLSQTQGDESILVEAQDVLDNRFDTLGSGKTFLGTSMDWQRDFKSGKSWPLKNSRNLDLLDLGNPSDVKVPWELSRFHQVWWLGKAYWQTRNEDYAGKFRDLVEDWINQNPPGKGVNWTVAMEVAFRAANWIAGYYFFCDSPSLSTEFWLRFLKSLYAHGNFIQNNLEYSWRNSNHFLSDVVGLIFLGVFFRHTSFGKDWLRWGVKTLPEEMESEVYPDGVDYEKSTSYQRLVLELFYSTTILLKINHVTMPETFMKRLEKMFEYVQHYSRPDGSIPLFGDADDGRLFRFIANQEINDHRHALAIGSILFGRNDFADSAGRFPQDALWLFGGEGFEIFQRLRGSGTKLESRSFPDGGFYIMRNDRVHLMVDAGDIGMKGWGGHGHNDTLSFELWVDGEPVIVDSGTYAYTFDVAARQELRGGRAHNSVMIDGKEIATFVGLWMILQDRTRPSVYEWTPSPSTDVLEAAHHAYQSLLLPVVHRRRFILQKQNISLEIHDMFEGFGEHTTESFLHFAPGVRLHLVDSNSALAVTPKARYRITSNQGVFTKAESWFSPSYGVRQKKETLVLSCRLTVPSQVDVHVLRVESSTV